MSNIYIKIDHRESPDCVQILKTFTTFSVETAQLKIADFNICMSDAMGDITLMYIERKTWDDLAASIKDGRCDTQFASLKEMKNCGRRVLIVVEGKQPNELTNCLVNGMNSSCLWGKLRWTCLRGIPVMFSASLEHTLKHVAWCADSFVHKDSGSNEITFHSSITGSFIEQLSQSIPEQLNQEFKNELLTLMDKYKTCSQDATVEIKRLNPDKVRIDMLKAIFGNSKLVKLAKCSVLDIIETDGDNINTFSNGKRVKKTTITNAKEYLKTDDLPLALLQCVPGCSKTRAEAIITKLGKDFIKTRLNDIKQKSLNDEVLCNNRKIPKNILLDFCECIII